MARLLRFRAPYPRRATLFFLGILAACVIAALSPSGVFAGQNAGSTCRMYWLHGDSLSPSTGESGCQPTLLITAKGIHNLRGADVQILIHAYCSSQFPQAWQWWQMPDGNGGGTEGCASEHNLMTFTRGVAGIGFSNPWTGVPGVAVGQAAAQYYNVSPCLTPNGMAFVWMAASGTGGPAKDPSLVYGLFKMKLDLATGQCAGDCSGPRMPMCIILNFRQPCSDPGNPRGPVIGLTDANGTYDYAQGFPYWLVYYPQNGQDPCPTQFGFLDPCLASSVKHGTWSHIRGIYR